ncbi:MAG: dihydrofolate reductase family protein [Patescibacteria group bacterium]
MNVFLIAALSGDGFLGRDEAHNSMEWTSKEDSEWFWTRTEQAGAIVMGRKTFGATRRPYTPLPNRKNYVLTGDPTKWQAESQYPLAKLEYTNLAPAELLAKAEQDAQELGFSELAICGGTSIYTQFLLAGLLETLYLTRETNVKLGEGIPLFAGQDLEQVLADSFKLAQEKPLNNQGTLLQEWRARGKETR